MLTKRKREGLSKWTVALIIFATTPHVAYAFVPTAPALLSHKQRTVRWGAQQSSSSWYPTPVALYDDDIFSDDFDTHELEERLVALAADLISHRLRVLDGNKNDADNNKQLPVVITHPKVNRTVELVSGRFMDLACTTAGETALETLFWQDNDQLDRLYKAAAALTVDDDVGYHVSSQDEVIYGVVMVLQSLCVAGTQVGVMGPPEQLRRMVAHLKADNNSDQQKGDNLNEFSRIWDNNSVRQLKYKLNRAPAMQLLSHLKRRKQPQGAFDLLVALGAWGKHEDLALLRSGFPIRFTKEEEDAVEEAMIEARNGSVDDPDELLGLRQDLRHLKVYTIDSKSTSEIDDGVSVQVVTNDSGETTRQRIWIHIADADRWAPRNSKLFEAARRRITSLYLPTGPIPMFPLKVGTELMSLKANEDVCALSLGVELNDNGSIDESSIIVTPSLIRVSYRLTYEDVDEMLEEGIGYNEEWQLGALLDAATKRRAYRVKNGSAEGMVPNPVPFSSVSVFSDKTEPDGVGISVNVQVSHNAAKNKTATAEDDSAAESSISVLAEPVSSAYLLVTEAMILSGEAMGRWQSVLDSKEVPNPHENCLRLPYRTQRSPDLKSRARERRVMMDLLEYNVGNGLCHAWYSRRFLDAVRVTEMKLPHSGLGLGCYVQWSSPIRRFSDLQVHGNVKRFLRRRRVYELLQNGDTIPQEIGAVDLGVPADVMGKDGSFSEGNITTRDLEQEVNYLEGFGLFGAAKKLQRQSQQYWIYEYIRRLHEKDPDVEFSCVVLGCIDPEKQQYAIYIKEIGLEHRYTSPKRLDSGDDLQLKVDKVLPRSNLLTFVRVV